jgi:hypothetical protein
MMQSFSYFEQHGKSICQYGNVFVSLLLKVWQDPYTGLALQATIRQPTTTNIYKALGMQFTVGTFPFLVLTFVGYWAYGNTANPYLLLSLSGPKSLVTIANAAAFLQAIVSLHVSSSFTKAQIVRVCLHRWHTEHMLSVCKEPGFFKN